MAGTLAATFSDFNEVFNETLREADEILGFSLSELIQKGPPEDLRLTENTQPALLTVSTAMSRWMTKNNIAADVCLGHSLGEYSALVHAGAIKFKDALKIVHLRGKLMSEALPAGEGSMAALIGANPESAAEICEAISGNGRILEPSVYNSSGQIVISGHMDAIDEAVKRAKEFNIRIVSKLDVSGPFHCSLLTSAGKKLKPALEEIEIKSPNIEVISNTTALPEKTPEEILSNLVAQVSKPVLWAGSLRYVDDHYDDIEFVEVGSGKVLCGIMRKVLPDAKCTTLETLEKLELLQPE